MSENTEKETSVVEQPITTDNLKIKIIRRDGRKFAHVTPKEKDVSEAVTLFDDPKYYSSTGLSVFDAKRLSLFWDLMDTIRLTGYLRAAISVIGRSAIAGGWDLTKHSVYGEDATETMRKRLYRFYNHEETKTWDSMKDFYTFPQELLIATMYLKFFGQCGWHILRNKAGQPVGLDFLYGAIVPNVDENGKFTKGTGDEKDKTVAFYYYPTRDVRQRKYFESARDVLYIVNPSFDGHPMGASDIESLTEFNLPLSLYLNLAARKYMENRDTPELVYELPPDISDEAFDEFVDVLESRYTGPQNMGKNPVVVAGELNIKEVSNTLPKDLPYSEAKDEALQETLAVTGANADKLGINADSDSQGLKEIRREFHETTVIPLFRIVESAFYSQIHWREFNAKGWRFQFSNPDFLNAVERTTVHMRQIQHGIKNPNEVRVELGLEERTDEYGDEYVIPGGTPIEEEQGAPPEGREDRPDAPGETGEPTLDDQDPPRGDGHDDTSSSERSLDKEIQDIVDELVAWKHFTLNRNGKPGRNFVFKYVPSSVVQITQERLGDIEEIVEIKRVFDEVIFETKEWYREVY